MARTTEFWTQFRNTFNPFEVLVGKRGEDLYCDREYSPFNEILLDFRPGTQRKVVFFTGHRGSGKSSMLLRLLDHLKEDFFLVYFDILHNLDSNKTNQIDLLFLLGAAIHKTATQEGLDLNAEHLERLANSVYTVIRETKETEKDDLNLAEMAKNVICFGASLFGNTIVEKLAEKLTEAALKPFTLSSGVSEEIARKREIDPQVQKMIGVIKEITDEVERLAGKPVLTIVDGLDKLQRLEQAEIIFLESRALREPVCSLIYTVPMLIFSDLRFAQVEQECFSYFWPCIKLYDRNDAQRHEDGYKALGEVVEKRLIAMGLQRTDELFETDVLDLLIFKSGGVIRLFINLVQDAGKQAELLKQDRVSMTAARRAIDNFAAKTFSRFTWEVIRELRMVHERKWPSDNAKISSNLLHGLQILAYRGPGTWFDAHPLLWEELRNEK